jgi:WD40 repeat protein
LALALDQSDYFLLLASPLSAASLWVNWELEYWLTKRSSSTILFVLVDGHISWGSDDFDWTSSNAVPQILRRRLTEEPRYLDLRWARTATDLSLTNSRFADGVADIVSTLTKKDKALLIGEDYARQRRFRRLASAAISTLSLLAALAITLGIVSESRRREATSNLSTAFAQKAVQRAFALDYASAQLYLAKSLTLEDRPDRRKALAELPRYVARSRWTRSSTSIPQKIGFSRSANAFVVAAKNELTVLDSGSGAVKRSWKERGDITAMSVDADVVAVAVLDGSMVVRDVLSGDELLTQQVGDAVEALLLRGGMLAVGMSAKGLTVFGFDVLEKTVTPLWHTEAHEIPVASLASDGSSLYFSFAGHIKTLDLRTTELTDAILQEADTLDMQVAPSGRYFAAGARDGSVLIVDHERRRRGNLRAHSRETVAIAFDQNSRFLVSASADRDVHIWKLEPGEPSVIMTLPQISGAPVGVAIGDGAIAVAYDSGQIATFDAPWLADTFAGPESVLERNIQKWEADKGSFLGAALTTGRYSNMIVRLMFMDSDKLVGWGKDGPIVVWNLRTMERAEFPVKPGVVSALQPYSGRAEHWLASDVLGTEVSLYGLATGRVLCSRTFASRPIPLIAHPTEQVLVGADANGLVFADRCPAGNAIDRREIAKMRGKVTTLAFDDEGAHLVLGTESGQVRFMNWPSATLGTDIQVGTSSVAAVASAAGRFAAVLEDGSVVFAGPSVMNSRFVERGLARLAMSRDAQWLALGGRSGLIHVLDTKTMAEVATFGGSSQTGGEIAALAFSDGAERLVSSSSDNRIQIWDMAHVRSATSDSPAALLRRTETQTQTCIAGFDVTFGGCR